MKVWSQWLRSEVPYQGDISHILSGFLQGSVIGPCLVNFTLNGLDDLCQLTQKITFDSEKSFFITEHYGEHYKPGKSTVRNALVQRSYRYIDEVVIVSNDMNQLSLLKTRLVIFLSIRGLKMNKEKSFTIK